MQPVPAVQNPRISKTPRLFSPVAASLSILWLAFLVGGVFTFSLARPCMRGSLRTTGGSGSAGQIYQFVSDFIEPENHETSFFASEHMLKGEMVITTVAFLGEIVLCLCISY